MDEDKVCGEKKREINMEKIPVCVCLSTRHGFEQLGITHLSLPDVSQCVLHPLGPPQEIKHPQVVAHTLPRKHLTHTHAHTHINILKYSSADTETHTICWELY